jgi:cytochrome b pre-mRNA-processing protein 3
MEYKIFMNNNYINIYNSLINLTRNKNLYQNFTKQDTFSDRLIFLLLHFAFFLKAYKNDKNKDLLQKIYDFVFRQLELSIREIGYGDQSINKKMKDYINLFYGMLDKIHMWDNLPIDIKKTVLLTFLDKNVNETLLVDYFDKYSQDLANNTLNFYLKGVIKR